MLRCGVLRPEQMEAQDEFLSLEQEFARCQEEFCLLPDPGAEFCCCGSWAAVLPAVGLRAQAGGEAAVLVWPDRIFTEVWALLLAGGTALLLVLLTEYENRWIWAAYQADSGQMDTMCAAGTAVITAWVLLAAMFLRTVTVRLKVRALARTTLLCRVVSFLWRRFSVFFRSCP